MAGYRSTHDRDDSPGAIERLQARPISAAEHPLTETERVTARPAAYPTETAADAELRATRPMADEGPDSRRPLL